MDEEKIEVNTEETPQKNIEFNGELTPQRTKRLRWIDQARGFVMVYVVWTLAVPDDLTKSIPFLRFFFDHPEKTAPIMNLFDIGTPAFMFIIGLSLSIAFWKYAEKKSVGHALLRVLLRFGLLFLVGFFLEFAWSGYEFSALFYQKTDAVYGTINMVWWDVTIALGFVGMTALPFIFIKNPWIRTGVAYVWMGIYQVLLMTTDYFRVFALQSIHSGLYASLFTFTTITVIGTALGDYMFSNKDPKKKQYAILGVFGGLNLLLGIGLGFIPGMYWSKAIGTLTFGMVSIGIITLGSLLFIIFDEVLNWKLKYFVAFGMNPLLSYMVAEVLYQLPEIIIVDVLEIEFLLWMKLIVLVVIIVVVSLINWLLYRKKKRVRTEWVTLAFFLLVLVLSFVI